MEQHLIITKSFYDKLQDDSPNSKYKEILNLYGYQSGEEFLSRIINQLNRDYAGEFHIIDFITTEDSKYGMYNAYIQGNFDSYDEVTISFNPFLIESRDTIINQNLLPLVQKKIEENPLYLINSRIKKIYLLTAHNSEFRPYTKEKNTVNSTFQKMVNCLNTMNFEVIPIFPVKNLILHNKYSNIQEFIDHVNSMSRNEVRPISLVDNKVYFDIKNNPQGNDFKFFAMEYYTAIMLDFNYTYDITAVTEKCGETSQINTVKKFMEFVSQSNLALLNKEFIEDKVYEEAFENVSIPLISNVNKEPETIPTKTGRKYKTQKSIKDNKILASEYICDCNDEQHTYFISSKTNKNYIEGHHIIPMMQQDLYWSQYSKNLDVIQNISPLCPKCHRQIHNGTAEEKMKVLEIIFTKNINGLKQIDQDITIEKIMEYYNIFRI